MSYIFVRDLPSCWTLQGRCGKGGMAGFTSDILGARRSSIVKPTQDERLYKCDVTFASPSRVKNMSATMVFMPSFSISTLLANCLISNNCALNNLNYQS